ncbi:hypothetical protein COCMIDRAFT_82588 [Bipolaris oryzae ATCC 44560]|uniref:Uncharacterized protein n=1 Tax=Bipolaris oryzae ATCC 44560 TaxID=930090 RepID=W7A2I5_COCMI|nr:uncharacterized protein COCMIDRAFT_82588 [Bipolaris oryzae ATCC 44560]EUC50211.1 hypothetical protein COCMIDRAFT_82588 [Bipolaris oryzae ATCC 44560]
MTAPPAEPFLFAATHHMHFAYPSPASTVDSDTTFHCSPMSPRSEIKSLQSRKTSSVSPTESPSKDGGLCWIVANEPAKFKAKDTMHIVRKKAMVSFLETGKSRGRAKSRAGSEASDESHAGEETQSRPIAQSKKKSRGGNKPASPDASSKSKSKDDNHSNSDTRIAKVEPQPSIAPRTPIVVPINPQFNYAFDKHNIPLRWIGMSLDPFGTMFQSSNPNVSVEKLKHHCRTYFGTQSLGRVWIPKCLDHPHTFLSTLFMASAHDDVIHQREVESLETAALRQDVVELVVDEIRESKTRADDANIIAVSQLILGEVISRTEMSLAYHQDGMEKMIRERGGLDKLGVNGYLASAVSWAHLATAVLRETSPSAIYVEYCVSNSTKEYLPNVTAPESPLYCPRGKYVTVEDSRAVAYQPNILRLLNDMRTLIEEFLEGSKDAQWNSNKLTSMTYRITQYPALEQMPRDNVRTQADWKYEAIRITSVVQAYAINNRTQLSDAITHACPTRKMSTIYTSSLASQSSESLPSPFDVSYSTPDTDYFTSPSFGGSFSFGSSTQQPSFPFVHRSSDASTASHHPSFSSSSHHPSFSSQSSISAETLRNQRRFTTLSEVKEALEQSNLSDCWGDMAGVLLWIGLVMGAASYHEKDKVLRRYFSALTIRACIMLCFEHPEAMHATMLKMTAVVDALRNKDEVRIATSRREFEAPRKRTKA